MINVKEIVKGEVIILQDSEQYFKVLVCNFIQNERSPFFYLFIALTYNSKTKPNVDEILNCEFIGTGFNTNNHFPYEQNQLDKMWQIHPEIKPYCLGSYNLLVNRKFISRNKEKFESIGRINIIDNLDMHCNTIRNANDIGILLKFFDYKQDVNLKYSGVKAYKVKAIIKE